MKISQATPRQLRQIEKCSILAAGGKPNTKVFGKPKGFSKEINSKKTNSKKTNSKKTNSKKTTRDLSTPLSLSKY